MKLLRRRSAEPEDLVVDVEQAVVTKGRPTPKRRDSTPRRQPVTQAPRNRKEAYRWQKEQAQRARTSPGSTGTTLRGPAYREALRRGDTTVLPRRDQGPARKLARDWVDSRRLFSNYLLVLFPVMIIGYLIPFLNLAVIILFFAFLIEWYLTGRRIKALAESRGIEVNAGPMSLGFYAGSRAYLPRRWRMPAPQVSLGDPI
ncbi:MAG: DUF3043 domain-containing protein [Actinomycetota bacterium]